jgi:LemA protein
MSAWIWIVVGVVVIFVLWVMASYNRLVGMRQHCTQAFADIDVQLRQRQDLVPNLVETVRGYAGHERGTLGTVIEARNAAMAAKGPAAQAAAENALSGALRQVFALAEAYPNLKANSNFQQLQTSLANIENHLAAARRKFNEAVQRYNTAIQQAPTALFATALGFTPHQFFELGEARPLVEPPPQVKF